MAFEALRPLELALRAAHSNWPSHLSHLSLRVARVAESAAGPCWPIETHGTVWKFRGYRTIQQIDC